MRQGETKDRKLKRIGRRTRAYSQAALSNYVFYLDIKVLDGKVCLLVRKTLSEMYVFHLNRNALDGKARLLVRTMLSVMYVSHLNRNVLDGKLKLVF